MSETEQLSNLLKAGYKIELIDPYAIFFNEKFRVYTEEFIPESQNWFKELIKVDKNGNISCRSA